VSTSKLSNGAIGGIVGGIVGAALLFLMGVLIFLLHRRSARPAVVDQKPDLPVALNAGDERKSTEIGGMLRNERREEPLGGRLRYEAQDGQLNSHD
jgi:hypothetical protein